METYLEREQTLDVEEAFEMPSLAHMAARFDDEAPGGRVRLVATYYDTADLRLLAAGLTLRHRTGGGDAGWHLKVPAGPVGTRLERRLPPSEATTVPEELAALVTGHVGASPLRAILVIDTERETTRLADVRGGFVEVADDRVVAERLTDGIVRSWREVEVERSGEDDNLAGMILTRLLARGARPADFQSKVGRAMRDSPGRPAAGTDVLALRLRGVLDDIAAGDLAVRVDGPDAIHRLRVAVRRFRSALRTFGSLLEPEVTAQLTTELRWIGGLLGEARDGEVLAERIATRLDRLDPAEILGPVRADLLGDQRTASAAGRAEVLVALAGDRYRSLIEDLHTFAATVPYRPGRTASRRRLHRDTRHEIARVRRRAQRAATSPAGERDAALHAVRKAAKRVRYAAETLAPADGKAARRLARRYERIQEVLGDRNDAAMLTRLLAREGAHVGVRPGHNGYTYGVLAERERHGMARLEQRWDEAWHRARRKSTDAFLAGR